MSLSDLLRRIKSALGIGGTRRRRGNQPARKQGQYQQGQPHQGHQQGQHAQGQHAQDHQQGQPAPSQSAQSAQPQDDGVNVTVEREPSTESEDAVKGTDTAEQSVTETPEQSAAETADDEPDSEADLGTDEPVDVIKGIGATYADRLGDAGVETVAELAASDIGTLSEESGISEGRLENWIEKAKHR